LRDTGISKEEAYHLAHNDIDRVRIDLDQYLPWWSTLDETRQRVLANMCFNMGIVKLLEFTQTLKLIKQGQYDLAASAMLASNWAKQVGPRAIRLADLMRRGGAV
jgi:lysozyme